MKPALPLVEGTGLFDYGSDFREFTPERFGLDLRLDGRIGLNLLNDHGSGSLGSRWDDGEWHMVTMTYESPPANLARVYVDGKLDKMERYATVPATNGRGPWTIGRISRETTSFRGVLDDVRVYARALRGQEVMALYRCSAGIEDIDGYYYLPILYPGVVMEARAPEDASAPFRQEGKDYAGIQLARSDGNCAATTLEGADAGQDLRISTELLVPKDEAERTTEAGAYFRSRSAAAGDGIAGGTSAGYSVTLNSGGIVRVHQLNPVVLVAFAPAPPDFDAGIFHLFQLEARGETLRVWLDGKLLSFEQGDQRHQELRISPGWEGPPRVGNNKGAAGISFGASKNRGQLGGQRVRNLRVKRLD